MAKKKMKEIDFESKDSALIAKKDFHLFAPPEIDLKIKEGDDLSNVPEKFLQNLKTEGII